MKLTNEVLTSNKHHQTMIKEILILWKNLTKSCRWLYFIFLLFPQLSLSLEVGISLCQLPQISHFQELWFFLELLGYHFSKNSWRELDKNVGVCICEKVRWKFVNKSITKVLYLHKLIAIASLHHIQYVRGQENQNFVIIFEELSNLRS